MGGDCTRNNYRHTHVPQSSIIRLSFGFSSISLLPPPVVGPQSRPIGKDIYDTLRMHQIIKSSGVPNYLMVRAPVNTTFNIHLWRKLLTNFDDHLVLDYLEYGFPLDTKLHNYVLNVENHTSAKSFPGDVSEYFAQETAMFAMLGPFSESPLEMLHCSPLLTRPKDITHRRVIVNLTWPKGDSINSNTTTDYDNYS